VEQSWQKPFSGLQGAFGQRMNDSCEVHRGGIGLIAVVGPSQSFGAIRQT
jgi:acetyltransferase-like isoleucine patch superfamily enzyme